MRFRDIQHQDAAISLLRRALRSGRTHHAYLFDGPDGVGKELTARVLAGRLLCVNDKIAPDADACGECSSCRQYESGNHPDFHFVERAMHRLSRNPSVRRRTGREIMIDVVREFIVDPSALGATQGARRVFVIRDAERMNPEAQNCLLKTLEEPPGSAVLILVTSSPDRLFSTIRSRCQRIPFGLLPREFVERELRARLALDADQSQTLAALVEGRLGVALQGHAAGWLTMLEKLATMLADDLPSDLDRFWKATDALVKEWIAGQEAQKAAVADDETDEEDEDDEEELVERTTDAEVRRNACRHILSLIAAIERDALATQIGAGSLARLTTIRDQTSRIAQDHSSEELTASIRAVVTTESMLERNVAPQLAFDALATVLSGDATLV